MAKITRIMDDKHFDKKIREKIARYQDPGVDPGALTGLHDRLDNFKTTIPWYKNRRYLGYAAAAVLFISLLNFSLYSYINQYSKEDLLAQIASLKSDQQQLYKLQHEFNASTKIIRDTVYLYKEILKAPEKLKVSQVENYVASLSPVKRQQILEKYMPAAHDDIYGNQSSHKIVLANLDEAPEEVKSYLATNDLYTINNGKRIKLVIEDLDILQPPDYLAKKGMILNRADWGLTANISYFPVVATRKGEKETAKSDKNTKDVYLSANVLRALEKNEMRRYGFRIGPSVDFYKPIFDLGNKNINTGIGFLAEFVLSPSVRLESGFNFTQMEYKLDPSEISNLTETQISKFPSLNPGLGKINAIEVTSDILSMPLNFKYFYPLSKKKRLFVSTGYTPMLFLSQKFLYAYKPKEEIDDEDDFRADLTAIKRKDNPKLYAGTFNVHLGMESQLKKNTYLQAAVFYQNGIDDMGVENRSIEMVGLKSSLFFKIR